MTARSASTAADGTGLRVLIVEDEALIALELEDILEELGHTVVAVAETVDRALAAVDRHAAEVDAALIDANLRGETAVPVAERLAGAGVPFLVTTGYDGEQLARLGFRDVTVVAKPYHREGLRAALARITSEPAPS